MIYTLTMNPSLDYVMEIDELSVGNMNRSESTYILPGGKGLNVSMVLNVLGIENKALLPVAGFTGKKLLALLDERKIQYEAIELDNQDTRINVKVLGEKETELNAKGPTLSCDEVKKVMSKMELLQEEDILVISGSLPSGFEASFYSEIIERVKKRGVKVILDTIGESFLKALPKAPFLVKPNQEELEALFREEVKGMDDVLLLAKKVQAMGAENVLVSLGVKGALLLTQNQEVFYQKAPQGKVQNTVGAGDSMVAGFLATYVETGDFVEALKVGVAAGSASAFSKNLATKEEIDALRKNL